MNRRHLIRLILLIVVVLGIGYGAAHRDSLSADQLSAQIQALGVWGPIVFIVGYALAAVLFIPGSALTLAGGALFGPWLGGLYSLTGATLGAAIAFLIARTVAGDFVRRRAGARLEPLLRGVEADGWRFVAFTRLVPLFPFSLLNYAFGLTRTKLGPYVLASFICMIPGALAYTWLGYAGAHAAAGDKNAIQAAMVGLSLLATAMFLLPRLAMWWRARGASS